MIYEIGHKTGIFCIEGAGPRAYLVTRPETILVDTGLAGRTGVILRGLAEAGAQPIDLKKIILTHHHVGHVGGLAELKRRSGAVVLAHRADAPYISGERLRRLPRHRLERAFHSAVSLIREADPVPVEVDRPLDGDEQVAGWQIIHAPGHTPGHICLLRDGVLISGDVMNASGQAFSEMAPETITDLETSRQTIVRLAFLDFKAILPGHNPPYVIDAATRVRALALTLPGPTGPETE